MPPRENSATPTATTPRAESVSEQGKLDAQVNLLSQWMAAIQERLEKGDFDDKEENRQEDEDHEMSDAPDEPVKAVKAEPESTATNPTYPPLPMSDY